MMLVQSLLFLLSFREVVCDLNSNSLMQKLASRVSTLGEEGATDSSVVLANAHSYITDMAEKVAGHNYTVSPEERQALQVIGTFIDGFFESMQKQFSEDQVLVNAAESSIQQCTTDLDVNLGLVKGLKGGSDSAESRHDECRNKEAGKKEKEESACGAYHTYRRSGSAVPPACLSTLTAADVTAAVGSTKKANMESCLRLTKPWLTPLYDEYMKCKKALEAASGERATCTPKQSAAELGFCEYSLKLSDSCDQHSTCRGSTESARTTTHGAVAIAEKARQADWKTSKKVECFLKMFEDSTTNADKPAMFKQCKELSISVSDITIVYPAVPATLPCTKAADQPCAGTWVARVYKAKVWFEKAPAGACVPCA